jgi:AcrR family transcriptional regulator
VNEKLEQILRQSAAVFMRYGIKSVTMDDICRELGISKKTLYQFVEDKADLISKVLNHDIKEEEEAISAIVNSKLTALEELHRIQGMVTQKVRNMHSSIIYDLRKYYPEAWNRVMQHRNDFVVGCIEQNIRKGQAEGVFRTDIHPAVIARIYSSRIEVIIDSSLFADLNLSTAEIYVEAVHYHIRGIATEKGLRLLETIENQSQTKS